MKIFNIIWQVSLLYGIALAGDFLVKIGNIPLPGNILGIVILFTLLYFKVLKTSWLELGANFLMAELLLFFIPPTIGIIKYMDLLQDQGLILVLVITGGTFLIMLCSTLLLEYMQKKKAKRIDEYQY